MALLTSSTADPVQAAIDFYKEVTTYQVTLKSVSSDKTEVIHYYFKKPGYVRMEFDSPFKGAVLIYDPTSRRAKLWPFGYGTFPALSLSPDNGMIQSSTGQRVDRSDVGVLYRNVKTMQQNGTTELLGIEELSGKEAMHISVTATDGFTLRGTALYQLWLDRTTGFPLRVMSHARDGRLIEVVEMEDLRIDPSFPDGFFRQ